MCAERRQEEEHSNWPFTEGAKGHSQFDGRRFFELLLVALVAGACASVASAWATTQVLSAELERQQRDIQELKKDIRDLRRDLYRPHMEYSMLISELTKELEDSLQDAATVFEPADFNRHVRIALHAMAVHKRPRLLSHELTLKPGETRYAAPADIASIDRLVWQNESSRIPWANGYPGPAPLPSLVESDGENEIRLSPPPTAQQVAALSGKCELLYKAEHETEEVPGDPVDHEVTSLSEADRYLVLLRAQAEACRELAFRNITKPVDIRGGGLSTPRNMTPRALWQSLLEEWNAAP